MHQWKKSCHERLYPLEGSLKEGCGNRYPKSVEKWGQHFLESRHWHRYLPLFNGMKFYRPMT